MIAALATFYACAAAAAFAAAGGSSPAVDLFLPGAPMHVGGQATPRPVSCYRLPVLLAARNGTVLAFASARNWTGDGCYPFHPPSTNGTQRLAVRISRDGGRSFGPITQVVDHQMVDYQAVFDRQADKILVQSCYSPTSPHAHACGGGGKTRWVQTVSTDNGASFSAVAPIGGGAALGVDQGIQPGAGRALQLVSAASPRPGRLLFCGHTVDAAHGNIAPIWVSDDHGETYNLTAVLPRGLPQTGPAKQWGPDECSLAELSDGRVRLDARNNAYVATGQHTRMTSVSTDGYVRPAARALH
jgi:sialidase-1